MKAIFYVDFTEFLSQTDVRKILKFGVLNQNMLK